LASFFTVAGAPGAACGPSKFEIVKAKAKAKPADADVFEAAPAADVTFADDLLTVNLKTGAAFSNDLFL